MEDKHREPELEQYRSIWLTKEAYDILRDEKKMYSRSMASIVDEMIKDYGEPFHCRGCKGRNFTKKKRVLCINDSIVNYALCGDCGRTNTYGDKHSAFFKGIQLEKSVPVRERDGEELFTDERKEEIRRLRKLVEERDGKKKCAICGDTDAFRYQLDHKYPKFWGGGDELENLQILCLSCNSKKCTNVEL